MVALPKQRVKDIQAMNKEGEYPPELLDLEAILKQEKEKSEQVQFADVTGGIELPETKRRRKGNNKRKSKSGSRKPQVKRSTDKRLESKDSKSDNLIPILSLVSASKLIGSHFFNKMSLESYSSINNC